MNAVTLSLEYPGIRTPFQEEGAPPSEATDSSSLEQTQKEQGSHSNTLLSCPF